MKTTCTLLILALIVGRQGMAQATFDYPEFGSGIKILAGDSSGSVRISARIQNLVVVDQDLASDNAEASINALVRRARLKFDGFAFSEKLTYKIELGLSQRDIGYTRDAALVGSAARIVMDAVVKYEFVKGTTLWFGQTKLPGNRERVISSQSLQFVDRSLLNSRFNIDRDFGIQLHHQYTIGGTIVRLIESVSLGEGRNMVIENQGNLDYTFRAEVLPFGAFASKGDYFSSDLKREAKPKLSIGVSADFNRGAIRQSGQLGSILTDSTGAYISSDLNTYFADMMFKYKGFSCLSEAAYRESSRGNFTDANGKAYNQGFAYSTQAGYLFSTNIELAGRYTRVVPLSGMSAGSVKHEEQYTLGLSKYFLGHDLKVQTDLTYGRSLGYTFADENLMFRIQTELSF